MRAFSVCSGIGAPECAWRDLPFTFVGSSEIEPFPCKVLAHRFPTVPNVGDMERVADGCVAVPAFDVLVGGTPCQSFSVAGLRGGLADARGNLALSFCQIAGRYRPEWILWENVPGVLSSDNGRAFGSILGALVELGYGLAWRVLDAQNFGVPQRRRRVFLAGHSSGSVERARAVLFEREGVRRDPAPRRTSRQGFATGAAVSTGGDRTHALTSAGFDASEDGTGRGAPIVATERGREGGAQLEVSTVCPALRSAQSEGGGSRVLVFDPTQITSPDNRCNPKPGDPSHPLSRSAHPPVIAFHHTQDPISGPVTPALSKGTDGVGVFVPDVAHALTRHSAKMGDPTTGPYVAPQGRVRRVTPLECERLQGFLDGWTDVPGASDSARYRALGNSMAVPVLEWIGRGIMEAS